MGAGDLSVRVFHGAQGFKLGGTLQAFVFIDGMAHSRK
jgi:hypothetical protein